MTQNLKKAYLAGGCFWGMEDLFRKEQGIVDTEVGYTGGNVVDPTYQNHDGHAEALEITYNVDVISYQGVLDFFFRIHNPTTVNQQGNDRGTSYRSAIFYQNEDEKLQSEAMITIVNQSGRWPTPVVTTLEKYDVFYRAEPNHQDYLKHNPFGYTCHYVRWGTYLDETKKTQA